MYEQRPQNRAVEVLLCHSSLEEITTFAVIAVRKQIKKMLGDLAKICASDTCSISIQTIDAKTKKKKKKEGLKKFVAQVTGLMTVETWTRNQRIHYVNYDHFKTDKANDDAKVTTLKLSL